MSNFKDDILEAANGEPIEAIVIGEMGWGDYKEENKPPYRHVLNKILSWDDALLLLDYEYDTGYGAPDCQAITAWTKNQVLFVVQYDGSTNIYSVPRSPIEHVPCMPGG
jgi:hypothetical protein